MPPEDARAIFVELARPFLPDEVKFRSQGGRQLAYVTARTIMNRLDDVLKPENWWDEYEPHEKSVICRLTIRLPDGSTLTKWDAGGYAGMQDSGDDDKSGFSDAYKRAAVKFGIGRYLYSDGLPTFVTSALNLTPEMLEVKPPSQNTSTRQSNPAPQSRPGPSNPQPPRSQTQSGSGDRQFDHNKCPKNGKGLWAWAMDESKLVKQNTPKGEPVLDVVKWLNNHGQEMSFPDRIIDWDEDQTRDAWDAYHGEGA